MVRRAAEIMEYVCSPDGDGLPGHGCPSVGRAAHFDRDRRQLPRAPVESVPRHWNSSCAGGGNHLGWKALTLEKTDVPPAVLRLISTVGGRGSAMVIVVDATF